MNAQMVASDDANPNFVGAHNPDDRLPVMFYSKAVKNDFESQKQGRPIFYDVDMVKIFVPGDDTLVVDTYVREDHKQKWPRQWAHYQNKKGGDQRLVGKTPLTEWPRLSQSQVEELRAMKFFSVDDIANASDMALQGIGMVGGMSPFAFRDAAQRFLKVAAGDAADAKLQAQLAEQTQANASLQAQMLAMQQQLAALASKTEPLEESAEVIEPPRRGRPPKT